MNKGALIAVIAVAAYIGFEAYAIRSASERMEPAYIHNLLIEAQTATQLCQSDALEFNARFVKTLQRATSSYRDELSAKNTELTSDELDALLEQDVTRATAKVTAAVKATGCSTEEARAHFQRYRIYARKTP